MRPAPGTPRPGFAAGFYSTPRGRRFLARWIPAGIARGSVLVSPPFAEELNKCRRMLALTAEALASAGWEVLLPDLGGTGDSEGELATARVADWLDDLAAAGAETRIRPSVVLGVRLGATLAVPLLPRLPSLAQFVAWQPVLSGAQHLAQFLRLRVAGNLVGAAGATVTVGNLRAELLAGTTLDVAGYKLAPALARDLEALRFEPPLGTLPALAWLEVSGATPPVPGPASEAAVARWQAAGGAATLAAVAGEPFWATTEIALAPDLVQRSVALLESMS